MIILAYGRIRQAPEVLSEISAFERDVEKRIEKKVFTVITSLLFEDQILGQVRDAHAFATLYILEY